MAAPAEKLADSLSALKGLQDKGVVAIRTGRLSRTHRVRLLKAGFIREVMKGWYTRRALMSRPAKVQGGMHPSGRSAPNTSTIASQRTGA